MSAANVRIERQIRREQQHREDGDRRRQLAERGHHRSCPVDSANEVDDARDQPKQERAKRRLARETLTAACAERA